MRTTLLGCWALALLISAPGCKRHAPSPAPPRVRAPAPPRLLRMRVFAAGHADSILLTTGDGHRVLVDSGRAVTDDLVRRRLVPWFRRTGIRRLDAFVVTHPHPDHVGDPVTLRRHVAFDAIHTNLDGAVLLGTLLPGLRRAAGRPVRIVTLHRGEHLQLGELRLRVLNPPANARPASTVSSAAAQNDRSLVIRARFGAMRFLLAGDLTVRGERALLAAHQPVYAQVLKLGHHGHDSTSTAWLRRVKPRYAVASCGDHLGRPRPLSPALIARLAAHRVRLLRTDRDGDVVFTTDGSDLWVKTYPHHVSKPRARSTRPRPPPTRTR